MKLLGFVAIDFLVVLSNLSFCCPQFRKEKTPKLSCGFLQRVSFPFSDACQPRVCINACAGSVADEILVAKSSVREKQRHFGNLITTAFSYHRSCELPQLSEAFDREKRCAIEQRNHKG